MTTLTYGNNKTTDYILFHDFLFLGVRHYEYRPFFLIPIPKRQNFFVDFYMKNEKCTNTFWKKSYNSPKLTSQKYQGTDLIFIDFTMHQAPHKHTGGKKAVNDTSLFGKN